MSRFAEFGNDLYTGKRSIDFVGRLRTWLLISAVMFLVAGAGLGIRHLNLGIEFTGGSDFRISNVADFEGYEARAKEVISTTAKVEGAKVTRVSGNGIRVETERFDDAKSQEVSAALAKEFKVNATDDVSASVVGPSWGASVTTKALQALLWFLLLVSLVLALYFRTWKMALAALIALVHDIFITVGVYALLGLEVTPASMIGFLTILGYSLYDTVVVFDKVRENTDTAVKSGRSSFAAAANLGVNQTLVRSINTTIVALLPVTALLLVGVLVLGPGTLLDLSVALFIGIAVGAYSSVFIAPPIYAWLRAREPDMKVLEKRAAKSAAKSAKSAQVAAAGGAIGSGGSAAPGGTPAAATRSGVSGAATTGRTGGSAVAVADDGEAGEAGDWSPLSDNGRFTDEDGVERTMTGRPVHPYLQRGPRNQPRRQPRSKR